MKYNKLALFHPIELLLAENIVCFTTIAGITRIWLPNVAQNTTLFGASFFVDNRLWFSKS
jgi:hypothetical protein